MFIVNRWSLRLFKLCNFPKHLIDLFLAVIHITLLIASTVYFLWLTSLCLLGASIANEARKASYRWWNWWSYPIGPASSLLKVFNQKICLFFCFGECNHHLLWRQLALKFEYLFCDIFQIFKLILYWVRLTNINVENLVFLMQIFRIIVSDPSIEFLELVQLTKLNRLPLSFALQFACLPHFGFLQIIYCRSYGILPILLRVCLHSLVEGWPELDMAQFFLDGCRMPRPELHQVLNIFVYFLIKSNQELANVKILRTQWNAWLRFLIQVLSEFNSKIQRLNDINLILIIVLLILMVLSFQIVNVFFGMINELCTVKVHKFFVLSPIFMDIGVPIHCKFFYFKHSEWSFLPFLVLNVQKYSFKSIISRGMDNLINCDCKVEWLINSTNIGVFESQMNISHLESQIMVDDRLNTRNVRFLLFWLFFGEMIYIW